MFAPGASLGEHSPSQEETVLGEDRVVPRDTRESHLGGPPSHDAIDAARTEAMVLANLFGDGEGDGLERVGRFVLTRRLGRGAMGEVFLAEDTELGRPVALKRISNLGDGEVARRRRQRMVREARALAKIDHPNVVRVYDVQRHGEDLYISMEFIKGATLTSWLSKARRSADELLEAFAQAGRGLAAAHAVNLVHRDFKPDNVLVGDDGRVRVVDFGLARADTDDAVELDELDELGSLGSLESGGSIDPSTLESAGRSATDDPRLRLRLTRTGAMMGTPAYMAPEQLFRSTVDHRSDQFSFCVALWEALYGTRPFSGRNIYELAEAMMADRFAEPEQPRRVSAAVRRALHRGLARDPEERFPSMDELVSAIDPARRRRRWVRVGLVGAFVATAVGVGVVARWTAQTEVTAPDPCPDPSPSIAEIWNPDRQARIDARFAEVLPAAYASSLANAMAQQVDGWVEQWKAQRLGACRATRVEGAASEHSLDLRNRCLDHARTELDALLSRLEKADEKLANRGPSTIDGLQPPSGCEDFERLEAPFTLPDAPDDARAVQEAMALLEEGSAAYLAGAYDDVLARARAAQARLGELDHAPTLARIHVLRGRTLIEKAETQTAERALLDAASAAERGRHDRIAAMAWIALASLAAGGKEEHEHSEFYMERARAAVARLEDPADLEISLLRGEGKALVARGELDEAIVMYGRARELAETTGASALKLSQIDEATARARWAKGEYAEAAEAFERVVAEFERGYGKGHPRTARSLNNLGSALITAGESNAAIPPLKRALAIREAAFGPDNADVGVTINALASAYYVKGAFAEAVPLYERAVEIATKAHGSDEHPSVARSLANLGRCQVRLGDHEPALASLRRAVEIMETAKGKDHVDVADVLTGLASAEVFAGALEDGLRHHERALTIRMATLGPDNAKAAESGVTIADTHRRLGDMTAARRSLARWLPVLREKLGDEHPYVGQAMVTQGLVDLEAGRTDDALSAFEVADVIFENAEASERALLDLGLGMALWSSDRTRANALLESVSKLEGPMVEPEASRARAWLAEHADDTVEMK